MTLRWRIAIGFAAVALLTAAVVSAATPGIVGQGFAELEQEIASASGSPAASGPAESPEAGEGTGASETEGAESGIRQNTIAQVVLVAIGAALAASLAGFVVARRMVRPLARLEVAAESVAHGDLTQRSGLAERQDEFGQLGRSFDSMAAELQRAEESRRGFLQDVAHELRTPLTVIDATSSAILDGVYPADRAHIETIRDQSRVLSRIVDDLRTITLAEAGRLDLRRQRVDLPSALGSAAAAFAPRASLGSVSINVACPAGLAVQADPGRLQQIVSALVDNALRYAPPGSTVGLVATPGERAARIAVEDSGPGFSPDVLPRVFERFYQGDPSHTRRTGTSGLGLSIVAALVDAHGGRVGAENRPEGGARVWFEVGLAS